MKKFLRGTQLVKQRAGVSEGTHDESYDQLEKELTKLQKTAKEMPKAVAGIAEGMKNMWKQYHKMTTELQKVSQQLELSPLCNEMSARLEVIGNEFDSEKLEKLQNDLNSSAIEVLRKLESDIKSLETVRNERSNRRLEYDAAKEKSQKKEAELMKKGKDVESDSTMTARRIEVETACKAYEVSNQRSIEEMTKVSSVKDDVFKMTAYNVASFVGAYLQASGEQMLAVKSSYEQAQVGGTVYAAPAAAAATAAAPTVDAAAAAASAAPAADTPSPPADAAARSTPEAAAAAPAAAAASAVEAAAPASQPVAATRPPGLAPPTAEEEAAVTAAVVGETPTKGPSSTDSPAEPAGSPAALGTLPPPLDDSSAAITRLPSTEVPVAAAAAQPAAAVSGVMAYAAEADVTDLPVTAPVEEPQPSTTDAAAAAAVAAAPADEATPAPEPVAAPEADAAPAAAAAAADATAAEEPAAAAPTVQPTPDETPADVAAPAPEAQVAADADADAGAAPTPAEVPSASSVDAAPATDAAAAPTTEVPVEEPVVNSADAE